MTNSKFLTVSEAADFFQLSKGTVYKLAQSGNLPGAFKVGKSWRFNTDLIAKEFESSACV